jgi:hypothetical protein
MEGWRLESEVVRKGPMERNGEEMEPILVDINVYLICVA